MIQSEVYQGRVGSFMSLGSADPDLIQISNLFRWWRLCVVTMTSLHGANHNCAIVVIRMAQLCHHCATSWWRRCRYEAVMATRDVNSWEITFPDWDAIPGSWSRLDFAPISTFYWRDRSQIAGGGRSPVVPDTVLGRCHGPIAACGWPIDIAGGGVPETSQNCQGATKGVRLGKSSGQLAQEDGPGNHRAPCRTPLDNLSTLQADGRMKQWAAWHTCRNADIECDGGTWSPTSPRMLGMGNPQTHRIFARTLGWHRRRSSLEMSGMTGFSLSQFLPYDAMLAQFMLWYMLWACVCLCLSVTSRCSTKMAKLRIKQTTPLDSPGTLVFLC